MRARAELGEATADFGVPRCLGPASFARTVWYVIPPESAPHEISVEASGETLDVLDLAAFVQPQDAPGPVATQPNACDGIGAGGAAAVKEGWDWMRGNNSGGGGNSGGGSAQPSPAAPPTSD